MKLFAPLSTTAIIGYPRYHHISSTSLFAFSILSWLYKCRDFYACYELSQITFVQCCFTFLTKYKNVNMPRCIHKLLYQLWNFKLRVKLVLSFVYGTKVPRLQTIHSKNENMSYRKLDRLIRFGMREKHRVLDILEGGVPNKISIVFHGKFVRHDFDLCKFVTNSFFHYLD